MKEKIIALSKISTKGVLKLPKEVMDILDLKNSNKILWIEEEGKIFIKKV